MKILKRLLVWCLIISVIFSVNSTLAVGGLGWGSPNFYESYSNEYTNEPRVDYNIVSGGIAEWSASISERVDWIIKTDTPNNYETSVSHVIAIVNTAVNRLLWILALVALIYMIYCWLLILSWEKNSAKWKKWISTAAIALAWIWLSWLIISAMLWFINNVAQQ